MAGKAVTMGFLGGGQIATALTLGFIRSGNYVVIILVMDRSDVDRL